jgi:hypothetical protein
MKIEDVKTLNTKLKQETIILGDFVVVVQDTYGLHVSWVGLVTELETAVYDVGTEHSYKLHFPESILCKGNKKDYWFQKSDIIFVSRPLRKVLL